MYKENFAKRIRAKRKEIGYTQKQIEQNIGIKQSDLSKLENEKKEPSLEELGLLAQFYNVSINWLLGVSIEPEIKEPGNLQKSAN